MYSVCFVYCLKIMFLYVFLSIYLFVITSKIWQSLNYRVDTTDPMSKSSKNLERIKVSVR